MNIDGWKYYNHAAVPTCAPHETPDLMPVYDGSIWRIWGGIPLLIRWTTDWECGHKTNWWYVIKDDLFDISELKSKRRYEVNKGKKNFSIKKINPVDYGEELLRITIAAYSGWPEKYRPEIKEEEFFKGVTNWKTQDVFAAYGKDDGKMSGYALLHDYNSYVEFSVLRTDPTFEKLAVNAAMIAGILEYYKGRFDGKFYISDGLRAIRHETNFQDYLEKYFGFRKAYCKLNIKYRWGVGLLVRVLYPFHSLIISKTKIGSQISGIFKMEEIKRSFCDGEF